MMADEGGLKQIKDNPLQQSYTKPVNVPVKDGNMIYRRSTLASIQVEDDTCCIMGNFELQDTGEERNGALGNGIDRRGQSYS